MFSRCVPWNKQAAKKPDAPVEPEADNCHVDHDCEEAIRFESVHAADEKKAEAGVAAEIFADDGADDGEHTPTSMPERMKGSALGISSRETSPNAMPSR